MVAPVVLACNLRVAAMCLLLAANSRTCRVHAPCLRCASSAPASVLAAGRRTLMDMSRLPCRRRGQGAASASCALVVSDTSPPDAPHAVYLFRRWLPLTFVIRCAPLCCSARLHPGH